MWAQWVIVAFLLLILMVAVLGYREEMAMWKILEERVKGWNNAKED